MLRKRKKNDVFRGKILRISLTYVLSFNSIFTIKFYVLVPDKKGKKHLFINQVNLSTIFFLIFYC